MAFDCKGNKRGRCSVCPECEEFTPWNKNIRCGYCDCPPTKHQNCSDDELPTRDGAAQALSETVHDQQVRDSGSKLQSLSDHGHSSQQLRLTLTTENSTENFARGELQNGVAVNEPLEKVETLTNCIKVEENAPKTKSINQEFKCPICRKKFRKTSSLKSHILLHKGKIQFKCKKCPCLFKSLDDLLKHKKSHFAGGDQKGPAEEANGIVLPKTIDYVQPQKRKRKPPTKMTKIAPKRQSMPNYQSGMNLWGSSNQNSYLMSPLTGGLFPQVSMPPPIIQNSPLNHGGRGFHSSHQQNNTQIQDIGDVQSNVSPKMFNLLQGIDAKINVLVQIDRKLDYIIHSLSMPRQPSQEAPQYTVEADQVSRSLEQIAAQIEDPVQPPRLLPEHIPDREPFKRESLSPGEPVPDSIVEQAYRASVSRRNLAKNLVFMVFTADELRGRNCSGKVYGKGLPKERLDPRKLHSVKMATFKKYPCDPQEMDLIWQRECIKAIDKAIRSKAVSNRL